MDESDEASLECGGSSRNRREKKKDGGRFAALQRLRDVKRRGELHKAQISESADSLFEEIDEEEYSDRVRKRQDDDWIVDDGKSNEFKSKNKNVQSTKSKQKITSFFKKGAEKMDNDFEKSANLKEDKVLQELLEGIGVPSAKPVKSSKTTRHMPASVATPNPFAKMQSKPVRKREPTSPLKIDKNVKQAKKQESPLKDNQNDNPTDFHLHDMDNEADFPPQIEGEIKNETNAKIEPSPDPQISESTPRLPELGGGRGFLKVAQTSEKPNLCSDWDKYCSADTADVDLNENANGIAVDAAENYKFYWLDAFEDPNKNPGTVYLFGRVEGNGKVCSCCVTVNNIERVVYVLPRETRFRNGTDTGEELDFKDVHEELKNILFSKAIQLYRVKMTTKKYAFSDGGVPAEAEYIELRYSANKPALDSNLCGETFWRVFGTTSTSLETLLLDANLRGPGWLNLKNASVSSICKSWCQLDLSVDGLKSVMVMQNGGATPPLRLLSLSLLSSPNPNRNQQQEIVAVGILLHRNYQIEKGTPKSLFTEHYTIITKPASSVLPFDFKDELKKKGFKNVEVAANERALLNLLLLRIQKLDPDIIIGHDMLGYWLDLLMHRISSINVPNWSRLSRLRRGGVAPKNKFKGSKGAHIEWTAGRLILDSMAAAKELIRSRSFDLTQLAADVLGTVRQDISPQQIPNMYSSSEQLLSLIKWTMNDALLALRLTHELSALPLFLQITQVAGGVLSRTLMGGRADRNEYLLLHAFHDKHYLCPDRVWARKKQNQELAETHTEEGDEETPAAGSRKKTFVGGLVLEPKKGLYDSYILLLDFNSLYPSIIQEYNICFTTVNCPDTKNNDQAMAEVPPPSLAPGILPTEIRKLVESRREVKKLMKNPNLGKEQLSQYDIRQLALKLTANSMYGCLGFGNSRFHAKPLAALITYKGREILLHTKELVEKMGLEVVYGDTDSIMINTNSKDFDQAMIIGKKVKCEVNKLYRLLELDIDGVYKRLLLLKKKKYAGLLESRKIDGSTILRRELKGVDNVRRDWSALAKQAGEAVIEQILGDEPSEIALENIHQSLIDMGEKMRQGAFPLQSFQISKALTKAPSEYSDKKGQPHVSVAARLNNTGAFHFKQGDTVAYIICLDGTSNPATQRAYHTQELNEREDLKIDLDYYLGQQVHPVVTRLVEPIEGTDSCRIAECLGLDTSVYRSRDMQQSTTEQYVTGPVMDFSQCTPFTFPCLNPKCAFNIQIHDAFDGQDSKIEFSLSRCPGPECDFKPFQAAAYLVNHMHKAIRCLCNEYYKNWFVCGDTACKYRTRRVPLRLAADGCPICPSCKSNTLKKESTERSLFLQLSYWQQLFDVQSLLPKKTELEKKKLNTYDALYLKCYSEVWECVNRYMKCNAYCEVDLGSLFNGLLMNLHH